MADALDFPENDADDDEGDSTFSVRVLDRDGRPVANCSVALGFTAPLRGVTDDELTGADGIATFLGYRDGEAKVFVSGQDVGTYHFVHCTGVSVTIG
ncbi:MAG: hypothetical protein LAO06_17565 [Acidobacteriia bacterium]|nr:hypothetical protein [Terriglobia bacterium]